MKQRIEDEIQPGQAVFESSSELEDLTITLVSFKNRYFHRGGFSPSQLVFGVNPRLPVDMLSDDQLLLPALDDLRCDPLDMDSAASDFARSNLIRQRARELCMKSTLKDKSQLAMRKRMHRQRTWTPGQWVYVWRKYTGTGGGHTTRARWTGPGLVVQQHSHTVWVSMRSRIWKCSSDQLRPANQAETIGAEMMDAQELKDILTQVKGKRAAAIDVQSEGPPPQEHWDHHHPTEEPIILQDQHPPISAEPPSESPGQRPTPVGQGEALRQVGGGQDQIPTPPSPRPPVFDRRVSAGTVEEPLHEPTPASTAPSEMESLDGESKRRKTIISSVPIGGEHAGPVRKRVQDLESERREKEALKYLRQMDREERAARAKQRANPMGSIPASSDRPPDPPPPEDDALLEWANSQSSFFNIAKGEQSTFLAKPAKAKNSEFNMKTATPEERKGFRESDASEWE